MKTKFQYVVYDPDQRGNDRYYVRIKGRRKIRIRQPFKDAAGNITKEFSDAVRAAVAELMSGKVATKIEPPPRESTFNWLCDQYYRSTRFQSFDIATQKDKKSVLGRFCETAGDMPYKKYRRDDMEKSQKKRSATPGAADKLVKVLRALFNWAIDQRPPLASENPAAHVGKIDKNTSGFHTWTPEEIDQFRAYWPMGTRPRLAMELMINIGARRSDAATIGRRNEYQYNGARWIRFVAHKGRNRFPVTIEAKLTPEFLEALEKSDATGQAYVLTQNGRPYKIESFGNAFSKWCKEAGLPHCNTHGLRKAAAVAFAESGATAPELMAVFGWSNLKTAQIYIEKANKRKMRTNAFDRKAEYEKRQSVSLSEAVTADETNEAKNDV